MAKQKITTHLWFDANAEEAVNFYVATFAGAAITSISRYPDGLPAEAGKVMAISFTLEGQEFVAINGGPYFQLTPAISLFVDCADQAEIDRLWAALSQGGQEMDCGWVTDQFGVTWQINTQRLPAMMGDPDRVRANRVVQAMLKMKKIDIAALEAAFAG